MSNKKHFYYFSITFPLLFKRFREGVYLNILLQFRKIVFLPFFTRFLGPSGMGVLNIIMVTSSLLMPIFELNLKTGTIPFLSPLKNRKKIESIFNTSLLLGMLSTVILSLTLVFSSSMASSKINLIIILMGFYIFSNNLKELLILLPHSFQKTSLMLRLLCFIGYIGSIFSVFFLVLGLWIPGILLGESLSMILGSVWLTYYLYKHGWKFKLNLDNKIHSVLKLSIYTTPVRIFQWVMHSLDSYFIIAVCGKTLLGIYSVAYMFASPILAIQVAMDFMWVPNFSRLYSINKEDAVMLITKAVNLGTAIFGGFFLICIIWLKSVLVLIAGTEYSLGTSIALIMTLCFFIFSIGKVFEGFLFTIHSGNKILKSYAFGAGANLILNFIFIPKYGILGAAGSTLFSYTLSALVLYYFFYKKTGCGFQVNFYVSIALLIIISILIRKFDFNKNIYSSVLSTIAVVALFYVPVYFLLFKKIFKK